MIHIKLGKVCINDKDCRRVPHSLNSIFTMHWSKKHKWTTAWKEAVAIWKYENKNVLKGLQLPLKRANVRYVIRAVRLQDQDNAWGSTKVLTDSLKIHKFIHDDDPEHLHTEVVQEKVKHRVDEGVDIFIKEQ